MIKGIVMGGTAMTTIGYCTTEADGRINDQMMWLHDAIREKLSHMNRELKRVAPEVKISGQMTHCGNFSKNSKLQRLKRPLGPSRQFSMLGLSAGMPFSGAMSVADIDYLVQTYFDAALLMKETGFDALEALVDDGQYTFGEAPTIADVLLVPQMYNAQRFKIEMDAYPKLVAAVEHSNTLDAFHKAAPEQQADRTEPS